MIKKCTVKTIKRRVPKFQDDASLVRVTPKTGASRCYIISSIKRNVWGKPETKAFLADCRTAQVIGDMVDVASETGNKRDVRPFIEESLCDRTGSLRGPRLRRRRRRR